MSEEICARCSARDAALKYFDDHVADEDIGKCVDGFLDAAAIIAANHVIAGKEAAERGVLLEGLGETYDRTIVARAMRDADEGGRQ